MMYMKIMTKQYLYFAVTSLCVLASCGLELSCVSCDAGFYLDRSSEVCRRCPANMSTFEYSNASLITDCECDPGHFNVSSACRQCGFGTYKPVIKNESCSVCMSKTNTTDTGSLSAKDCLCYPGFTPDATVMQMPNYSPELKQCVPCDAGFFKSQMGDNLCLTCPVDHYCPEQSVNPIACPKDSVSLAQSSSIYDCTCTVGNFHQYSHGLSPSLVCVSCQAGSYSSQLNASACTDCPSNTYYNVRGANNVTDCYKCPEHAVPVPGSANLTDCFCNVGYSGTPGGECQACPPGTFKNSLNSSICEECGEDHYNERIASNSQTDCRQCPHDQTSQPGSSRKIDCVCREGQFAVLSADRVSWNCNVCLPGTYQEAINASSCDSCPAGKFSNATKASLVATCQLCSDGYYSLETASSSCVACQPNTWQDLDDSQRHAVPCQRCPGNSSHDQSASVDIHDCVCLSGFVKFTSDVVPNRCDLCRAGSFCPGNGTHSLCPYNTWSPGGVFAGPCTPCASLSLAMNEGEMTGRHLCQCVPGTEGLYDSLCKACPAGKYQPFNYTYPDGRDFDSEALETVATSCLSCPGGNFSDSQLSTACLACPPQSESPPDSDSVLDCVCNPGFFGPDGGACSPCPPDKFCLGGETYTQCRPHSTSKSHAQQEEDCKCDPGYVSSPDNLSCKKCPAGYYCHGDQHQAACSTNSSSVSGSYDIEACTCNAGMWRNCIKTQDGRVLDKDGHTCIIDWTVACQICEANYICVNNTMRHCPVHSTAPQGSADEHACVCDEGFFNVFLHDPNTHEHEVDYEHSFR